MLASTCTAHYCAALSNSFFDFHLFLFFLFFVFYHFFLFHHFLSFVYYFLSDVFTFLGEELQCGRHGYSARDNGFRFDIEVGTSERRMSEEKIKMTIVQISLEKEKTSREKVEKRIILDERENSAAAGEVTSHPEDMNPNEESSGNIVEKGDKVIIDDSQGIGMPQGTEKGNGEVDLGSPPPSQPPSVPPTPIPIPTHPHAGDPLLVEDPGEVKSRGNQ